MRQGNVFTPVCHPVHRGEWQTPLGADTPPRAGKPPSLGADPPPGSRQPPGADPWHQTPPRPDTPSRADTPHAVHAGRYGQQAVGTHPTGMHTCFVLNVYLI